MTDRQFMLPRTGGGEPPHPARRRGVCTDGQAHRGSSPGSGCRGRAQTGILGAPIRRRPGDHDVDRRAQGLIAGAGLIASCVRLHAAATDRHHAGAVCPLGRLATRIGRRLQMSAAWWWSARAWPCSRLAPTGPAMWSTYCRRSLLHSMPRPGCWQHYVRNHRAPPRLPVRPDVRPAWIRQPATGASVPVRVLDVWPR
jgi:hypothetical protein